jgi:photosystem II stability/assembly factor-like uncharacterized protein
MVNMKKILYFPVFILLISTGTLYSQWAQLPGPYGGDIWGFYEEDSTIYTSTTSTIYASKDGGHNWNPTPINLPKQLYYNYRNLLFKSDSLWFVETSAWTGQLLVSTDNGSTFKPLLDSGQFSVVKSNDTIIVARNRSYWAQNDIRSLIRSTDNGKTWVDISPKSNSNFAQLKLDQDEIFALKSNSFFQLDWQISSSRDHGITWDSIIGFTGTGSEDMWQPSGFEIYNLNKQKVVFFAIDSGSTPFRFEKLCKYFLLTDSISLFSVKKTPFASNYSDTSIRGFFRHNNDLYASTIFDLYRYIPESDSWKMLTKNLNRYTADRITNYFPIDDNVPQAFLLTFDKWSRWNSGFTNGAYRYIEDQKPCIPSDSGMTSTSTAKLFMFRDTLYSLTAASGHPLYYSIDHGLTWKYVPLPFDSNGYDIRALGGSPKGLLYSNESTIFLRTGLDSLHHSVEVIGQILDFLTMDDTLFCRTGNDFYRSNDSGVNWLRLTTPPLKSLSGIATTVFKNLVIVGGDSIIISNDGCKSWSKVKGIPSPYIMCTALASDETAIYAAISNSDDTNQFAGIYRSVDSGATWGLISDKTQYGASVILPLQNHLVIGTDSGVFACQKNNTNWIPLFGKDHQLSVRALAADSEYLYIGTSVFGLYRTKLSTVFNETRSIQHSAVFEDILPSLFPNPLLTDTKYSQPRSHCKDRNLPN